MTSTSYPSATSLWRSGLRLISCCDIEDCAVLDLDCPAFDQRAFTLVAVSIPVRDCEQDVLARWRIRERQLDDVRKRQYLLRHLVFAAVHDDRELLAVTLSFLLLCVIHMSSPNW